MARILCRPLGCKSPQPHLNGIFAVKGCADTVNHSGGSHSGTETENRHRYCDRSGSHDARGRRCDRGQRLRSAGARRPREPEQPAVRIRQSRRRIVDDISQPGGGDRRPDLAGDRGEGPQGQHGGAGDRRAEPRPDGALPERHIAHLRDRVQRARAADSSASSPSTSRTSTKNFPIIKSGLTSCDLVRRTAWGTILAGEENGTAGRLFEIVDPLNTKNVVVTAQSTGSPNVVKRTAGDRRALVRGS